MALCATTALADAVPRLCVRGARGRCGGFGPVPGVVSLSFPPSRPACSALRVAGRPVRVSLTLARWYAIPRGLCVPRARSCCPSGSPRVPFTCVCARAPAASAPPPLGGVACAPRAVPALGAGRAVPRGPCPSACPAPVPCSVWRAWGGAVRSWFPPTWLGVVGVAVGRPRGGCRLLLRGASGVRRSPSPDCPPTVRAVGVRYPRVVGAGVRVWGPFSVPLACTRCGRCAPRGGSVAFVCRGAGWGVGGGGGGRAPYSPFVRPGGACSAGGRSASFRPSAFPGQATKRVSLVSCCPWGAWPPIRLRFVLARLLWGRSVRRPGALAPACLLSAAPVGASGWGGGAGRAPAPLSGGGGGIPPASGGGGRGPRGLRAGGGMGGGARRGLPAPLLGGGLRYSVLAPLVSSAHSLPACACRRGRGAAPGWGGVRGGPWTALPGAPADLNPPSALPEWAAVTGGSCRARPPHCSGAPPCAAPKLGARAAPARWCGLALQPRPLREQAAGGTGARVVQVQPHPPPPPRRGPFWGSGGGVPSAPGGWRAAPVAPKLGGGAGGGGGGGPPPRPPAPSVVGLPSVFSGVSPRGILVPWGLPCGRGRRARSVRPPTGQCRGGGGGGGGGAAPPRFAPPSSLDRPLIGPLRLRRPGRRRSPVGRQRAGRAGACLGRGAPAPRVQRPLRGGCGAAVSSVCLRPLMGLSGRGGGEWWGPSGPLAPPPESRGGGGMALPAPAASHRPSGSHPSPAPLHLEPDPRAGLRLGPSSPLPSSRGAGRPGAAVRVSGQRLAGCGAAGSPPRSLSPPSLPREVARAPASRRTVGGRGSGGPPPPPIFSRLPSGPSPAPPLVWGLGLWRRRVAPAVAPVGEGAAQGPGEPVVGVRTRDAEHRSPFQKGRPVRLPVGPRRPDH